jgi:hypothetical protein
MTVEAREPDQHLPITDASRHSRGLRDLTEKEKRDAEVVNLTADDTDEPWSVQDITGPDTHEGEITR